MKKQKASWIFGAALAIAISIASSATARAQVHVTSFVLASGGGLAAGSGIVANGTIGQPVIGSTLGNGVSVLQGFWFAPRRSQSLLGVVGEETRTTDLGLEAFPNPCRESSTVRVSVPAASHVAVRLYDELGNQTAVLFDQESEAGDMSLSVNAKPLPVGTYTIRATVGNTARVARLVVMR